VSSASFEHLSVHPQEDLFDQPQPDIDHTVYIDARQKYHKTSRTSLPEDEHVEVETCV